MRRVAPISALVGVSAAVVLFGTSLAGAASGAGSGDIAAPSQKARLAGRLFGVVPAARPGARPSQAQFAATPFAAGGNLTYQGGPVMHTNRTYAIYWIPSGYTVSANYKALIDRYFTDVAAASGATDNVYSTDTQYYDSVNGKILYSSSFGGSTTDTSPLPTSGCTDSYTRVCVTDTQIRQEIKNVVAAKGWPTGPSTMYFLFTAKGIGSCEDGTSSTCAYSYYCAYHSAFASGGSEILYANMPYSATSSTCDTGTHPNGDDADATLNVTSHEHNEAITDPLGDAWYDSAGNENGDKCSWVFGPTAGSTAWGQYNQVINGQPYYLQLEWSNASSSCAGKFGTSSVTPPSNTGLPVVSGTAQVGQSLSASTGSWSGSTPVSFSYQWQRCSSGCVNVGSSSSSYLLSSADVGSRVQVVVTASNSAGSASATSQPTGVVVSAPTSGTVTISLASGSDNGDVDVDGAQSSGYPPSSSPTVFTGSTFTAGRRLAWGSYSVNEPLLRFNAAGQLPAGATVTSATLKLFVNSWVSADNRNLVADWVPSAVWPLSAADFSLTPVGDALAPVSVRSLKSAAVNSFSLTNLASVSTSGYTTLRLLIDGGQPAGDNYVQFASYQSSTGAKPQLVLTYSVP